MAGTQIRPRQNIKFTGEGEDKGIKSMGYKVAVVGATGNVGREMLNILEERQFPVDEIYAIASRRPLQLCNPLI